LACDKEGEKPLTLDHTILLVEGRKAASERLAPILNEDYETVTARTRKEALAKIDDVQPAVIILDAPSLRFSRRRFCETLQEADIDTPVLLLHEGQADHNIGARAYLQHPFSAQKLINRVSWLLPDPESRVLRAGDLVFNVKRRSVTCKERETHLTPKQAHLLEVLMRHSGEVLTREFLMKQVWETDYTDDTRTLDVHIHWVRQAIEENTSSPTYLHTVRRVGYRFDIPQETSQDLQ
jgi:DNA-binding response OmpR family regulator